MDRFYDKMLIVGERQHIVGKNRGELAEFVERIGEPKYRADQIFRGLHERRLRSFDEMTDLPKVLRDRLNDAATVSVLSIESRYVSDDGTRRYLMKTADN